MKERIIAEMRDVPDTILAQAMDAGEVELDIQFCGPEQLNEEIVIKI